MPTEQEIRSRSCNTAEMLANMAIEMLEMCRLPLRSMSNSIEAALTSARVAYESYALLGVHPSSTAMDQAREILLEKYKNDL